MGLKLRIWMPLAAVLIVLLSIALMFLYGVPTLRARITASAQSIVTSQAAAAADALSKTRGDEAFRNELALAADSTGGEVVVVDRLGSIVSRAGESFLRVYLERMRAFDDHKEGVLVEQIMRHLWDGDFFGEARAADVHAQHIRSKVESDPQNPHYVLTVRGAGYKFADLQR